MSAQPKGDGERELLVAVLAGQLGFATPTQVLAAVGGWAADRSRGVAARLEEASALTAQQRGRLEALVEDSLAQQGGNPVAALASFGGGNDALASFGGGNDALASFGGGNAALDRGGGAGPDATIPSQPPAPGGPTLEPKLRSPSTSSDEDAAAVTPEASGRYESAIVRELGRGGIGRVLVWFDRHLGREVAVKELLDRSPRIGSQGSGAAARETRFLREARVTAQLEHPGIVPLYELGRRADGTLYYAMKRVRGKTLAEALAGCHELADRLRLLPHFVAATQAVAYAHSRGVIHRDLKPANVMVGEFGETQLLDWGLAKVAGKKDLRGGELARELQLLQGRDASATVDGSTIGTPAYMSPEQAEGRVEELDARTDVWALGAVLLELLTGAPPFPGDSPWEVLGHVLRDPVVDAGERERGAPPELAAIAAKALSRSPQDRYPSAREFAEDLEDYQAGGRVSAHAYTLGQLGSRYAREHRTALWAAAAALLVGLGAGGLAFLGIASERDRALEAGRIAERHLADSLAERASVALRSGDVASGWALAASALSHAESATARGTVLALRSLPLPRRRVATKTVPACGAQLAYAAGGRLLACTAEGAVALLDPESGQELAAIPTGHGFPAAFALSPSGERALAGFPDGVLLELDLAGRKVARTSQLGAPVLGLAFAADGTARVLTGERLFALDPSSDERRELAAPALAPPLAGNGRGRLLASTADGTALAFLDDEGLQVGAKFPSSSGVVALLVAADGTSGVAALGDGTLRVLSLEQGGSRTIGAAGAPATGLAWVEDGALVACSGADRTVRVFDLGRGEPVITIGGLTHSALAVASRTTAGEPELAIAQRDERLAIYSLPATLPAAQHRTGDERLAAAALFPDGGLVVTTGGRLRLLRAGKELSLGPQHPGQVRGLAPTADGKAVLCACGDGSLLVPLDPRAPALPLGPPIGGTAIVALADGGALVGSLDGRLRRFAADGRLLATAEVGSLPTAIAVARERFVVGAADGALRVFDSALELQRTDVVHDRAVLALAPGPAGDDLVSSGLDGTLRRYDPVTGAGPSFHGRHEDRVGALAASPDGRLVASAGADETVRLWDLSTLEEVARLAFPHELPLAASFDGRGRLLVLTDDGLQHTFELDGLTVAAASLVAAGEQAFGLRVAGSRLEPVVRSPRK